MRAAKKRKSAIIFLVEDDLGEEALFKDAFCLERFEFFRRDIQDFLANLSRMLPEAGGG